MESKQDMSKTEQLLLHRDGYSTTAAGTEDNLLRHISKEPQGRRGMWLDCNMECGYVLRVATTQFVFFLSHRIA